MKSKESFILKSDQYVAYAKMINANISPKKLRVIGALLRNMKVIEALEILHMHGKILKRKGFRIVRNVALSARANLARVLNEQGRELKEENYIFDIQTSRGSANRRSYLPRGKGSADTIVKYSSHITVGFKEVVNGKTD